MRYINPATDFGFKRIFKDEEITRGFLNALLKTRDPKINIVKVKIDDGETDEDIKDIRRVVYDVHCVTEDGSKFVIEMQNDPQDFFSDRIVYYLSRAASRQQSKGYIELTAPSTNEVTKKSWNYHLKNIYGVFFMNFKTSDEYAQGLSHFALMETTKHYIDSDVFQYWKIQMPFYREKKESDCKTDIDKWIFNLSNLSKMETNLSFTTEIPLFMRLEKIAEYSAMTKQQQVQYDDSYHNYISYFEQLKYKFAEGEAKGRAEGEAIGAAKERAAAHTAALQSAVTLYKTGALTIEQIAAAMKLDVSELEDFVKQN